MTIYDEHDAAKALREIEITIKRWTAHFNGIRVYGIDEDRRQVEEHRAMREWRGAFEADERSETVSIHDPESNFEAQLPIQPAPSADETGHTSSDATSSEGSPR